jgi:hypothetical protein
MKRFIIPIVGVAAMILLVTFWFYEKREGDSNVAVAPSAERQTACEQFLTVALFPDDGASQVFMEKCLRGDPVLPGDQVESPTGEEVVVAPPLMEPADTRSNIGAGCAVGGCSQQICGEAGEVESVATTCEWKEEYFCYRVARCEKQASGQCGWTETAEYNQCIVDIDTTSSAEGEVLIN